MKRSTVGLITAIIVVLLIGIGFYAQKYFEDTTGINSEQAVRDTVMNFGSKLQTISLVAPSEILVPAIDANYSDFVTKELLSQWENDPTSAPGRLTSSPWPDRIEISSVQKQPDNTYLVNGRVIEITSVELQSGGVADSYPVTIVVSYENGKWLISKWTPG